jgi:hypothetical protein
MGGEERNPKEGWGVGVVQSGIGLVPYTVFFKITFNMIFPDHDRDHASIHSYLIGKSRCVYMKVTPKLLITCSNGSLTVTRSKNLYRSGKSTECNTEENIYHSSKLPTASTLLDPAESGSELAQTHQTSDFSSPLE